MMTHSMIHEILVKTIQQDRLAEAEAYRFRSRSHTRRRSDPDLEGGPPGRRQH